MFDSLVNWFFETLYKAVAFMCELCDFLKNVFYMLCGIKPVSIKGSPGDLMTSLVGSKETKGIFLTVFVIGFILLVVFTMVAIIKSNYQEKKSWKSVLSKSAGGFLVALLLPFIILAGITLTNAVMSSVNTAMSGYSVSQPLMGGQFLTTIGTNCFKGDPSIKAEIERQFIAGELSYTNLNDVKRYYSVNDMNFIVGLLGSLVMLVMFVLSSITFVQRIFDTVLLYVISPMPIASIPIDDGSRFKTWKDMMISKILSAYGIILCMNIFFLIMPTINEIRFFDDSFHNGIVQILFLIGGSFAVTKAAQMISKLTGAPAGGGEMASLFYNIRSGFALAKSSKALVSNVGGRLIGGSSYITNRKKGNSMGVSLTRTSASKINQRKVDPKKQDEKLAKQIGGRKMQRMRTVSRLATMPIGMLHDLAAGGFVTVGKNFKARLNNATKGGVGWINHADVMKPTKQKKQQSEPKNDSSGKAEKGGQSTSDKVEKPEGKGGKDEDNTQGLQD